jgi:hypothetical protein
MKSSYTVKKALKICEILLVYINYANEWISSCVLAWQVLYYLTHTSNSLWLFFEISCFPFLFLFFFLPGLEPILLISASQVPQITGNGHWCLAQYDIFIHLCGVV